MVFSTRIPLHWKPFCQSHSLQSRDYSSLALHLHHAYEVLLEAKKNLWVSASWMNKVTFSGIQVSLNPKSTRPHLDTECESSSWWWCFRLPILCRWAHQVLALIVLLLWWHVSNRRFLLNAGNVKRRIPWERICKAAWVAYCLWMR